METCEKDNDCRSGGYKCVDISHDPAWRVVDLNPSDQRICVVPSTKEVPPVPPNPPICYPSDASFDVSRPEAGPLAPDADRADALDANAADRSRDAAEDILDSSPVETGADVAADIAPDAEPDAEDDSSETGPFDATDAASDASDEPTEDATVPDDADGSSDAGADVADARADVSAD
jgi:hypothetical protein